MGLHEDAYPNFNILVGQTITDVKGLEVSSGEVRINTLEGNSYRLFHEQSCCEGVYIAEIDGDSSDLVGGLVTSAEEVIGETPVDYKFQYEPESYTWTFYKINTSKGSVFIRWLGESNGYYSESVSFCDIKPYNKRWN